MTNLATIDCIIVALYLFTTLFIGIYVGRHVSNMSDFAISTRQYSTSTIIATIFATAVGGASTLGVAERFFSTGIIFMVLLSGNYISQIIISLTIPPKMDKFFGCRSVGEMMLKLYGKSGQVITGVCSLLVSIGFVAAQTSALGYVFTHFLGISYICGISIGCGVIIAYSSFGGIKSVIFTDILQFGILVIAIPLILNIGLQNVGGLSAAIKAIPAEKLSLYHGQMPIIEYVMLFLTFAVVGFNPSFIQRLLIVKNTSQAVKASLLSAILTIPFFLIVGTTGLVAYILNPDLQPQLALPFLIDTILPDGIKGFVIAGLMAAIMSSADSDLHIAGVSLMCDVIKPLKKKPFSDKQELFFIRIFTLMIGVATVFFAAQFKSIVDIIIYVSNFWAPTIVVPLIAGIIGIHVSAKCFIWAFISGVMSTLIWNIFISHHLGFDGVIIGMIMNALTLYLCNLYVKKQHKLS